MSPRSPPFAAVPTMRLPVKPDVRFDAASPPDTRPVTLSKVNPRQGRFLKLLPAIFLYMAYLGLLIAARGALDKGRLPAALGLWWVHGIFFAIGLLLLYWERLSLWWASRRAPVSEVAHG